MQSPQSSSRSNRRGTATDSDATVSSTTSSMTLAGDESGARSSSGSSRSTQSRRALNPQQQLSQIEKSVTHLLVATKQLLETLTLWSRGTATETEVSDVYVRLGYEFNIASRAFNAIGVDTQDLGNVPELLRAILEETLSQEASQASLDRFLPRIRDIIINLLHGLKKKQQRLRQRNTRDSSGINGTSSRPGSVDEEGVPQRTSSRPSTARHGSTDLGHNQPDLPPRTSSGHGRSSPSKFESGPSNPRVTRTTRDTADSSNSSLSSTTAQNIPVIAPYPDEERMPSQPENPAPTYNVADFPPPPPPPKQEDALAALQRGGELERRASRRFSAYQIQKHLGSSASGIPMLPPAQTTPVPNRGRDVRDSMNAVRVRGSMLHSRQRSTHRVGQDASPSRPGTLAPPKISEEIDASTAPTVPAPAEQPTVDSPTVETPDDKLAPRTNYIGEEKPEVSATVSGSIYDAAASEGPEHMDKSSRREVVMTPRQAKSSTPPQSGEFIPHQSPQPGKELTLFLQYKSKIKKFVLADGYSDLSLARLQLAFIEKFAWNTHNNGADLPDIYIQDPVSGVRHELEDLSDIKDRSVLVLNVEALDEVKRHFDDGLGDIRKLVEGIKSAVDEQQSAIQRVSDRQQDAAKEIASLAAAPPVSSRASVLSPSSIVANAIATAPNLKDSAAQLSEIQSLRRDLAVVRQTYTSFVSDIEASMGAIRTKAASVKSTAIKATIPTFSGESGRAYVNGGKKTLNDDSEKIVNRVDDLQDLVEDLRKDVVSRGVRPLPRQLDSVAKDISIATAEVKRLQDFLKREKPIWTKIWEQELQMVMEDREMLTMQEELALDLQDDLEKLSETFSLVEQATKQQMQSTTNRSSSGRGLRAVDMDSAVDPRQAKDSVLGEVRALQPNHESRLEAIERAEKARQRELESRRGGEFQRELGAFVEEGKLKKSGGVEEVERLRKAKDERIRKEVFERQAQMAAERERKRQEAAAARAAAAAAEAEAQKSAAADSEAEKKEEKPKENGAVAEEGENKEEQPAAAETGGEPDAATS